MTPESKDHGNKIVNAVDRESLLRVAIFSVVRDVSVARSATKWAKAIEENWHEYYRTKQVPPRVRTGIEKILRESMKAVPD